MDKRVSYFEFLGPLTRGQRVYEPGVLVVVFAIDSNIHRRILKTEPARAAEAPAMRWDSRPPVGIPDPGRLSAVHAASGRRRPARRQPETPSGTKAPPSWRGLSFPALRWTWGSVWT